MLFLSGQGDLVDLRLDLVPVEGLESRDFDFRVEVTDVAHDGPVLHAIHVLTSDHGHVAGRGHEDVSVGAGLVHGDDVMALHGRLERRDWVDLRYVDGRSEAREGLDAPLPHIAVSEHHALLASDHDVGCAFDPVHQRLAAAIQGCRTSIS